MSISGGIPIMEIKKNKMFCYSYTDIMLNKKRNLYNWIKEIWLFLFLISLFACGGRTKHESSHLTFSGVSSLMPLSKEWVEMYSQQPHNETIVPIRLDTINQLDHFIVGKTDAFFTHVPLSRVEESEIIKNGFNLNKELIAQDRMSLIVKSNSIFERIWLSDVRKIFSGDIAEWESFSQKIGPLTLYVDKNDHFRNTYFKNKMLKENDWSPFIQWVDSQDAVIDSVKNNDYGIGLLGLSYTLSELNHIKQLSIIIGEKDLRTPLDDNYPFRIPLYFYYTGRFKNTTKDFIKYCQSNEGQKIIYNHGIFPQIKNG